MASQHLTVVSPSPYPSVLPEHLVEFLDTYKDVDMEDGHNPQQLARILSLDLDYLQGRNLPDDPYLQEIRTQQAGYLEGYIQKINQVLIGNTFFLGGLLIEMRERALYSYLGYPSLEVWCETLHIDRTTIKRALQFAGLWPWLRECGYTIYDVADGTITDEKIQMLKQVYTKMRHELDEQTLAVYKEHFPAHGQEEPHADPRKEVQAVKRVIDRLPDTQQEQLQREIEQRYIARMRQEIDHVRTTSIDDLRDMQKELNAHISKAHIVLNCTREGDEMVFSGRFVCADAEKYALTTNLYWLQFQVQGQPAMSASQFGEYLLMSEPDFPSI